MYKSLDKNALTPNPNTFANPWDPTSNNHTLSPIHQPTPYSKIPQISQEIVQFPQIKSFSSSVPHLPPPPASVSISSPSYWRNNIILTALPFFLWGFPIHLLFGSRKISSVGSWLQHLFPFSSPVLSILSLASLAIAGVINAYAWYTLGYILYYLIGQGLILNECIIYGKNLGKLVPILIPLDFIWLHGHTLRKLVQCFNYPRRAIIRLMECNDGTFKQNFALIGKCRLELCVLYLIILAIHGIKAYVEYIMPGIPDSDKSSSILKQVEYYGIVVLDITFPIFLTLVLVFYAAFCYAIKYKLLVIKEYIRILITERVSRAFDQLFGIKQCYRRVADDILLTNTIFSLYMSLVIGVIAAFGFYSEFTTIGIQIFTSSAGKGIAGLLSGGVNPTDEPVTISNNPSAIMSMEPEKVRVVVAELFVLLLYAILIGLVVWQAVSVNDEVRLLNVWINDLVTEKEGTFGVSGLYEDYCALKNYIHSRLEQQKPALLSITLANFVPAVGNRLVGYRVAH